MKQIGIITLPLLKVNTPRGGLRVGINRNKKQVYFSLSAYRLVKELDWNESSKKQQKKAKPVNTRPYHRWGSNPHLCTPLSRERGRK